MSKMHWLTGLDDDERQAVLDRVREQERRAASKARKHKSWDTIRIDPFDQPPPKWLRKLRARPYK